MPSNYPLLDHIYFLICHNHVIFWITLCFITGIDNDIITQMVVTWSSYVRVTKANKFISSTINKQTPNSVKSVVYWTINQYSTACVKRWRCLEYVYPLMHCLVLLFSIAFVINKQWALLNDCWINTHYRYLGFIRTHPTIYNRLCIWLAVSPYMNGCAWLRARWPYTLYHPTDFNPSHKITLGLITTTNIDGLQTSSWTY